MLLPVRQAVQAEHKIVGTTGSHKAGSAISFRQAVQAEHKMGRYNWLNKAGNAISFRQAVQAEHKMGGFNLLTQSRECYFLYVKQSKLNIRWVGTTGSHKAGSATLCTLPAVGLFSGNCALSQVKDEKVIRLVNQLQRLCRS